MIEVSHICKDYGGRPAVDDLSFTLEPGRVYGFLGPNGAGKSTTMNIMTGYLAATTGTVTVNGHDILREAEEAKKHIGYLPEIPPVYGDMTVFEYLSFVAELKKVPKQYIREQCAKVMRMTMLSGYDRRMIRNLSKGYRQRVGLAQALMGDPEIIILDEPTVGLDPQQIIEIRNLIRSLKEGHTVVLSSHILSEISEVCDEILIISQGKLVAQGTPQELEKTYSGNVTLHLTVLAGESDVKELLAGVKEESELSFAEADGEERCACTVRMEAENAGQVAEEIARKLADAKIPVMEMHRVQQTLEDVFLTVTQATPGELHSGKTDTVPVPDETASQDETSSPDETSSLEGGDAQ